MELNNTGDNRRIFGLDILRAAAIVLVVLSHGDFLLKNTRFNSFPYFKMIDGVDLFFVLSGFLIGSILLKEINSNENFGFKALLKFWKRRWLRTLPNYYVVLLLNFIVVYYHIIFEDINQFNWRFLIFLQNFSKPFYGFFWESWSLSIEEWFYILSPILLLILLKFLSPKKSFIFTTAILMIIPCLYRIWIFNPTVDDFWFDVTFRKTVLTRLDGIAFGLLASWIYYYFEFYWNQYKSLSLIIGIALICFIVNYEALNSSYYKQIVYFSLTPFSVMLLLPFAQNVKSGRGMIAYIISHISKISYAMYLINLALVAEIIRDKFSPINELDSVIKYILYWIIVIVASSIIFKYFERPIMNLRDR